MTCFVVLAAGRGSRLGRVGDELHKCLIPLDGRAVLSRQFALAPPGTRLVVVVGYRADQVRDYVQLAHPSLDVEFVEDDRWGSGPGLSLLAARDAVGDDDLVFTACDTLWEPDDVSWDFDASWVGVAPLPAGTPAARWCRVVPDVTGTFAERIDDKTPDVEPNSLAWTALGGVVRDDLEAFWTGLAWAESRAGEVQLSSGLDAVLKSGDPLELRHVRWLDVGDEAAYRSALATYGSYDPVKVNQVTYVLPEERRVVKFHVDVDKITRRATRAQVLRQVVPNIVKCTSSLVAYDVIGCTSSLFAYDYVEGLTTYERLDDTPFEDGRRALTRALLAWWRDNFLVTRRRHGSVVGLRDSTLRFYRDKTAARVDTLDPLLRRYALDAVARVDWERLADGCVPGDFHGDMTFANVLVPSDDLRLNFVAIDWREDFDGQTDWGDLRYDVGKLLGSTMMHWGRATHGDFRRWEHLVEQSSVIRSFVRDELRWNVRDVEVLGALSLLDSASLYAPPLDEILVARATRWLTEVT